MVVTNPYCLIFSYLYVCPVAVRAVVRALTGPPDVAQPNPKLQVAQSRFACPTARGVLLVFFTSAVFNC